MKIPRFRIHLFTAIILQIELGVLIWANGVPLWPNRGLGAADGFFEEKYGWPSFGWTLVRYDYSTYPLISDVRFETIGLIINLSCVLIVIALTWFACERFIKSEHGMKSRGCKIFISLE
jgi:hypothetical protein